jgi:hypothetical protein
MTARQHAFGDKALRRVHSPSLNGHMAIIFSHTPEVPAICQLPSSSQRTPMANIDRESRKSKSRTGTAVPIVVPVTARVCAWWGR